LILFIIHRLSDFVAYINNSHWLLIVTFLEQSILVIMNATMKNENKGTA